MEKNKGTWIFVDILLAVIVGVMAFNFKHITALGFWIGYAALLLAVLMQIVPICLMFGRNIDVVYKICFHTVSLIYLVMQFCISIWALIHIEAGIVGVSTFSMAALLLYVCCCMGFHSMLVLKEEERYEM